MFRDHQKFFLHSGHWAEFPLGGEFPVLSDLLHCLHSAQPQFLQLIDDEDPHPDENLHILLNDKFQRILDYLFIMKLNSWLSKNRENRKK